MAFFLFTEVNRKSRRIQSRAGRNEAPFNSTTVMLCSRSGPMKNRTIQLIAIGLAIAAGAALLYVHPVKVPRQAESLPAADLESIHEKTGMTNTVVQSIPPTPPATDQLNQKPAPEEMTTPPLTEKEAADMPATAQPRRNPTQYWEMAEKRFNHQLDLLEQEQDPALRNRLIQNIAQYVRIDTMAAIEWALGLEDPAERQLAMEAINQYALTGIGAMIAKDETGFPLIKDTTVVSAVASTGLVEPGDYIIGMQNENGDVVSFEGMTVHEIVQRLRGKAGTEILLYIERITESGTDSTVFDVPVQRSLIVIQPPY